MLALPVPNEPVPCLPSTVRAQPSGSNKKMHSYKMTCFFVAHLRFCSKRLPSPHPLKGSSLLYERRDLLPGAGVVLDVINFHYF